MSKFRSIVKYVQDENYRFQINAGHGIYNHLEDKEFLEKKFKAIFGYELNLTSPQTFNEKLQWIKLFDRRPVYTKMVDKYEVREIVAETIGDEYLIPLFGVWDDPEDIDFKCLPPQFVLKCTHNSGTGMYICTDKALLDMNKVQKKLKIGMNDDYYISGPGREWPYKNVKKRIIAEKYLTDINEQLTDYKVHCFNGVPKIILVCKDRFANTGITEDFFDVNWNHLSLKRPKIKNSLIDIPKPSNLSKLLSIAEKLSSGLPFLRTDFYIVNEKIYFGELTLFPASGFAPFVPDEYDKILGEWIELPQN